MNRSAAPDVTPIRLLLDSIRDRLDPREVWLFGSRARGNQRPDSDWDLLVVLPDDAPDALFDPMHLWSLLGLGRFTVDIVPYTAAGFREDSDTPNTIPYSVIREGIRLT